jgi:hypothetical protein
MKLSIGPLGALTIIIGLTGCSSSDSMERPTGMLYDYHKKFEDSAYQRGLQEGQR